MVSVPSVVASLERVWVKLNVLLEIDPDPVNAPDEKSLPSILVPSNAQYSVVPLTTLVVVTVVVNEEPSFTDVGLELILYVAWGTEVSLTIILSVLPTWDVYLEICHQVYW